MAKSILPSPFISVLTMMIVLLSSGGTPRLALAEQKTWCVAKPSASEPELVANIDYCCNQGRLDCRAIQIGGACYDPNTTINHASVMMNLYYQTYQRAAWTCDFTHSGLTTVTDPSYGSCNYA